MKADSVATCHVLDHNNISGIIIPHEPVIITSATKRQQRSVATKLLPFHPKISMNAKKAPTFASINSNYLLLPELCDDDCLCNLRKDNFECVKEGEVVVEGPQNHSDGMWDYNILVPLNDPLPPITEKEVNVATATVSTKKHKKTRKVKFSPLLITSIHPIPNREDLN